MAFGTRIFFPEKNRELRDNSDSATQESYLEQNIIETPGLSTQNTWHALLAFLDKKREIDGARASVTCGP